MPKEVLASTTGAMLPPWLKLEQLGPFDAFAQAMGTTMLAIALVQCLCSLYTDARSLRVFALLYLLTGIGWLVAHPRAHGNAADVSMLPAMVAVLLLALQLMPGSALPVYGTMAAGFAYCAWLALRASLLEDNVGHRYIALAYATYPLLFVLYVALPSWLANFEMGYYAAVPAMIVGMMIVAVSLIRSRQRTEDELRRRVAAEESLRLLNVTLEDRVASRTGDLHDLVSGLESFNRSVSHDLLELSKAADAPLRLGNHELRRCVDEAIAAAVGADGRGTAACTTATAAAAAGPGGCRPDAPGVRQFAGQCAEVQCFARG